MEDELTVSTHLLRLEPEKEEGAESQGGDGAPERAPVCPPSKRAPEGAVSTVIYRQHKRLLIIRINTIRNV